ncbi:MAG: DUF1775 domain-containing protein [Acidimicrobiales bacterium]
MTRRLLAVPALAAAALLAFATAAGAHVELEPGEAVAGSTTTLTFSFHHGKDGTATTGLEVLLPEGASVVEIPSIAGWVSELDLDAGIVTWSGGSSPDGVEARFPLIVSLPTTPGEVLFKTIQTTDAGELAWIEEDAGDGEDSSPAPRLTLVADPNATTTTEPSTSTTGVTTSTTDDEEELPGTTLEAKERDDGTTSAAPWIIGSGVAAAVAVGAGGLMLKHRAG